MAVWKKLNSVTGEYEVIPGASFSEDNGNDSGESQIIPDLSGKTAIFMGDSYTVGMSAMLKTMCAEFGMTPDNRGKVSSSICGDVEGTKGFSPMWSRTNAVCTEYVTAGKTDDVALVVFMGGANDGFGLDTWIGTSIADTDTNHIYGAMHSILNAFRKTFQKAKIITVLQPSNYNRKLSSVTDDETAAIFGFADVDSLQKMDDYQFSNYAMFVKERAVAEVATFYNTAILDCCFNWHSVLNADDRAKYWNSDKLHLSSAGYEDVTNAIREKIIKIFSEEGDDDNIVYFSGAKGAKGDPGVVTQEQVADAVAAYMEANKSSSAIIGEITLLASKWVGDGTLYHQVVEIDGVTENSQVDLTPSVEQLAIFYDKSIAFVAENEDGVVTVYAVGQKPENDYTIQVTITEVYV